MTKFCNFFPAQNVAFMVLKTTGRISRFQRKNRFEKRCILTRDIYKIVFWLCEPNQTVSQKQILINISGNIGSFYKPIFALKPWDRAGHFEYHESYILSRKKMTKFGHLPQKWSKKAILGENLSYWCKTGIHLSICELLRGGISWNIPYISQLFFHFVMQCI